MLNSSKTKHIANTQMWSPLRLLNLYRITLAGLASILCYSDSIPYPLGSSNFNLFYATSIVYLIVGLLNVISIKRQAPHFKSQVYAHVLVDIAIITLLMHASGGIGSGMGILLVIAVAGGSLLIFGRAAILIASIATIALLSEQIYTSWSHPLWDTNYTQAGLLGASLFATAILAQALAKRLHESEALAEKRGVDLASMAQLTEYIIERMQTGILVIDHHKKIHLINASARNLLGEKQSIETTISELSAPLMQQVEHWWAHSNDKPQPFKSSETAPSIMPRFAHLGNDNDSGTLIFLEDMAAIAQQAQQLKLASLGRLTASIAHEIRNPLGAISHAGQLLAESSNLDKGEIRLTEIIQNHSQRVNTIIENIMQLNRRDRSSPEEIDLNQWLASFADDFCLNEDVLNSQIHHTLNDEVNIIRFDESQLQQVVLNLCQNGLRHGDQGSLPQLWLQGGIVKESNIPYLEIIDNGKGIDPAHAEHIFEPFFTTAANGSGLGLYISRELCESNQAHLNYIPDASPNTGRSSCFRITFADPRRRQVI
ncbi:Two-component sensor PilS [hydrothermal vent metagenome]|uniref:Two-component sensor PilS n=1 Tax=hydrothermal vent metagenome TaxID=652676 RepID=A0A3B0ZLJ3_9ZZZZ